MRKRLPPDSTNYISGSTFNNIIRRLEYLEARVRTDRQAPGLPPQIRVKKDAAGFIQPHRAVKIVDSIPLNGPHYTSSDLVEVESLEPGHEYDSALNYAILKTGLNEGIPADAVLSGYATIKLDSGDTEGNDYAEPKGDGLFGTTSNPTPFRIVSVFAAENLAKVLVGVGGGDIDHNNRATVAADTAPGADGDITLSGGGTVSATNWTNCPAVIGDRAFASMDYQGNWFYTLCKCCDDGSGGSGSDPQCIGGLDLTTYPSGHTQVQAPDIEIHCSKNTYYANDRLSVCTVRFRLNESIPNTMVSGLKIVLFLGQAGPLGSFSSPSDGGIITPEGHVVWEGQDYDGTVWHELTAIFSQDDGQTDDILYTPSYPNGVYFRCQLSFPELNLPGLWGQAVKQIVGIGCPTT